MPICQIQWINKDGKLTPDDHPSIGRCRCKEHFEQIGGRAVKFETSRWYEICAEHAKRLSDPGMHHWEFEAR
jgi:hypothetical protein